MSKSKKRITKSFSYDGKRYFVHGKTLQEVYEKMALKKRDLETGKNVIASSMKLSDWAETAVDTYKTNQAESTREPYMYVLRSCILSRIGDMQLKKIKPIHCQKVLNDYAGYSTAYIRKIKQTLFFLFDSARKNDLIPVNPAADLTAPAGTKTERRSITAAERSALLSASEKNPEYLIYIAMLRCGCRSSEARNLKRMDLQEQEGKKLLHIRGTKTKAADRYVPVPPDLFSRLCSLTSDPFDFLFRNRSGNPYTSRTFVRLTERLRDDMRREMGMHEESVEYTTSTGQRRRKKVLTGIDPLASDFVPYCLRHTYCTDLKDLGVDIRDAQYLMGHSDISMTANIYTHGSKDTALKVAEILGKVVT